MSTLYKSEHLTNFVCLYYGQPKTKNVLKQLDGIRCIYNKYIGAECMLERNEYMIKKSSLLIALFNGEHGGTEKTISIAKQAGLKIITIEP